MTLWAKRSGFLPGKSLGTGASGSRDVSFSSPAVKRRSFGVGRSSRGFKVGDIESMGPSEVTELGAVDAVVVGFEASKSESGGSVSVGDVESVDIRSQKDVLSSEEKGDEDVFGSVVDVLMLPSAAGNVTWN